jgi:DNA-binding Xre family transcriptional regulator
MYIDERRTMGKTIIDNEKLDRVLLDNDTNRSEFAKKWGLARMTLWNWTNKGCHDIVIEGMCKVLGCKRGDLV